MIVDGSMSPRPPSVEEGRVISLLWLPWLP